MNRGRRLSFIHVSTWPVRWGGVSSPARMPSESTGIQFPAHVCCPGESHACGERWDRLSQVRGGRECGAWVGDGVAEGSSSLREGGLLCCCSIQGGAGPSRERLVQRHT